MTVKIIIEVDLLIFRISLLCIISGPICFIIGMNMNLFYGGEVAGFAAVAW